MAEIAWQVSALARCKINLCLEVLGRRPDGYHDIASVFMACSLGDLVVVRGVRTCGASHVEVFSSGWPVPSGPSNLCHRAASAILSRLPPEHRWRIAIHLSKSIPPGAGLGGGSSDAAAVLVAIAEVLGAGGADLAQVAARLGADVPFFLGAAACALATDTGGRLTPLPQAPGEWLVIAFPGRGVSTAWAYSLVNPEHYTDGQRAAELAGALRAGRPLAECPGAGYNAFEQVICAERPDIADLLSFLRRRAPAAGLSGSGAACWAAFQNRHDAEAAAEELQEAGLWAIACQAAKPVELIDVLIEEDGK